LVAKGVVGLAERVAEDAHQRHARVPDDVPLLGLRAQTHSLRQLSDCGFRLVFALAEQSVFDREFGPNRRELDPV
jgi:hypothetical protein